MCIGIPMQVVESKFGFALCEGMGIKREVDTLLVGEQELGTWLLVFLNSAREVLSEENARLISNAVQAVNNVMDNKDSLLDTLNGQKTIDDLFSDLINREPPKPQSLIDLEMRRKQKSGD